MDWVFSCELNDELPLPPTCSIAESFDLFNVDVNSFYILERGENYIQCGGSKEVCTVEVREYDSAGNFRHFVFARPNGGDADVEIQMSDGSVSRQQRHCLDSSIAITLFTCYHQGEPWPADLILEDITADFD